MSFFWHGYSSSTVPFIFIHDTFFLSEKFSAILIGNKIWTRRKSMHTEKKSIRNSCGCGLQWKWSNKVLVLSLKNRHTKMFQIICILYFGWSLIVFILFEINWSACIWDAAHYGAYVDSTLWSDTVKVRREEKFHR